MTVNEDRCDCGARPFDAHAANCPRALAVRQAAPVATTRPTLGQALADAYAEREIRRREWHREASGLIDGTADVDSANAKEEAWREASRAVERLVMAHSVHVLVWTHLSTDCPVCTGEVTM